MITLEKCSFAGGSCSNVPVIPFCLLLMLFRDEAGFARNGITNINNQHSWPCFYTV
jgi:hypothetical protein